MIDQSNADDTSLPEVPQPSPAPPKPAPPHKRSQRKADRLRQEAFVRLYVTPTSPAYLHGTKAAIAAGYGEKAASSQASRLLKLQRIRESINCAMAEAFKKLTASGVTVAFIERQHLEAMARCRLCGDNTNEREHLKCLGLMKGAYDTSLHLDLTVKHEYDERLALAASRLARIALEDMGDEVMGIAAPVVVEVGEVEGGKAEAVADHQGEDTAVP